MAARNDTPAAMSPVSTRILISKQHSSLKGARAPGEITASRAGQGKLQDELRISYSTRM